jgi:hypothetical protein
MIDCTCRKHTYVFPLGTLGAISSTSRPSLEALRRGQAASSAAAKLLSNLSYHAVCAARDILRRKSAVKQEHWGARSFLAWAESSPRYLLI